MILGFSWALTLLSRDCGYFERPEIFLIFFGRTDFRPISNKFVFSAQLSPFWLGRCISSGRWAPIDRRRARTHTRRDSPKLERTPPPPVPVLRVVFWF